MTSPAVDRLDSSARHGGIGRLRGSSGWSTGARSGSIPPRSIIAAADLPEDVLVLLDRLLVLGGTYGDPEAGDPIELRIEHDEGVVEIIVCLIPVPCRAERVVIDFLTEHAACPSAPRDK